MRLLTKAIVHNEAENDETGEMIEMQDIVNPVENIINTSVMETELAREPDHHTDEIEIEDLTYYDDNGYDDECNEFIYDDDDEQVSMPPPPPPPSPAGPSDHRYVFYRQDSTCNDCRTPRRLFDDVENNGDNRSPIIRRRPAYLYRRPHPGRYNEKDDDKYEFFKLMFQFAITIILIYFFYWLFDMAGLDKKTNRKNITNIINNTFENGSNHN
ncbi:hypothetical protein DERP_013246 [Dermatophagoides pteronyssinus]|uniref:Uncharacterized protein n=1 Tax=Dermatophagoides pteronyssinus TaxID=6956 RepID=A0ABQ8IRI2_DERPT|nr:hypothetical protein DERP_013246 [Dermatophagoides pteronyssinus]